MAWKYLFSRVWHVPGRKLLEVTSACKKWAEALRAVCHATEFLRCLSISRKKRLNFGHLMERLGWIWDHTTSAGIAPWLKWLDIQPDKRLARCQELQRRNGWRVQITACPAHHLLVVSREQMLRIPPCSARREQAREEGRIFFSPLKHFSAFSSSPLHCKPSTSLRATYSFSRPCCALVLFHIFLHWSHSPEEASPVGLQKGPSHPKRLTSSAELQERTTFMLHVAEKVPF